ncbi:MAG: hypothetical protein LCH54_15710 [Bacteroidetes bacterium]|nr:hypothetical protein [Bacteroidota bacterium]
MDKLAWDEAEKNLSFYSPLKLVCDGYKVTIEKQISKDRIVYMVFVNGSFEGKWLLTDCEERRRFTFKAKMQLHSPKQVKFWKKHFKKDIEQWSFYYTPYFNSFRTLKSHLIKNNKEILLDVN